MQHLTHFALTLAEHGLCPDVAIRGGFGTCSRTASGRSVRVMLEQQIAGNAIYRKMSRAPIAVVPEKANDQHYEVPSRSSGRFSGLTSNTAARFGLPTRQP